MSKPVFALPLGAPTQTTVQLLDGEVNRVINDLYPLNVEGAEAVAATINSAYQGRQYATRALFEADTGYAPQDGTVVTAGGVAYLRQAGADVLPGLAGWVPFGDVTMLHFGAVGDGVADDRAALRAAILSGDPLDWRDKKYRITSMIDEAITHRIDWKSSGAKIICDFAAPEAAMIKLTVSPHKHQIRGLLSYHGKNKVRRGLYLLSPAANLGVYPDGYPDLMLDGFSAQDMRLTVTTDSAEGLLVEGGWGFVDIKRASVRRVTMAAGAGSIGSFGAFGISVIRVGSTTRVTPHVVRIENPDIDTIVSDDQDYYNDQDGIRVLLAYNAASPNGAEFTYTVEGGRYRNCRNRSFKGQANLGRVNNATFIRDAAVGGNINKGISAEINEQIGSISSVGCEFWYDGKVPSSLYNTRTRVEAYNQPSSTISNVRGLITGSAQMDALFAYTIETGAPGIHEVSVSNVSINGNALRLFLHQGSAIAPNSLNIINLANITCGITLAGLRTIDGGKVRFNAVNLHNTAAEVPFWSDAAPSNDRVLSAVNVTGFSRDERNVSANGWQPTALRSFGIVPDMAGPSAVMRPVAFTLAQDETFTLPQSTFSTTASSVLIVSVSRAVARDQAIFLAGADSVVLASAGTTGWTVGTTADPGSGNFRAWANVGAGVVIKNATVTPRTFTVWALG